MGKKVEITEIEKINAIVDYISKYLIETECAGNGFSGLEFATTEESRIVLIAKKP